MKKLLFPLKIGFVAVFCLAVFTFLVAGFATTADSNTQNTIVLQANGQDVMIATDSAQMPKSCVGAVETDFTTALNLIPANYTHIEKKVFGTNKAMAYKDTFTPKKNSTTGILSETRGRLPLKIC